MIKKVLLGMALVSLLMLGACSGGQTISVEQMIPKIEEKVNAVGSYTMDLKMQQYWEDDLGDGSENRNSVERNYDMTRLYLSNPEQVLTEGEISIVLSSATNKLPFQFYAAVQNGGMTIYQSAKMDADGEQRQLDNVWHVREEPYREREADILKNYVDLFQKHADKVKEEASDEKIDGKNVYCLKLSAEDESVQKEVTSLAAHIKGGLDLLWNFPIPANNEKLHLEVVLYVEKDSFYPVKTIIKQTKAAETISEIEQSGMFQTPIYDWKLNVEASYRDYDQIKGELIPKEVLEKASAS